MRAKSPTVSDRQLTCKPVPRCGAPRRFKAPELARDKSPARGVSTKVETLRACVLGEKRRLPAKYPEVTN